MPPSVRRAARQSRIGNPARVGPDRHADEVDVDDEVRHHRVADRHMALALVDDGVGQAIVQQVVLDVAVQRRPLRLALAGGRAVRRGAGHVVVELVLQRGRQRRPHEGVKTHRAAGDPARALDDLDLRGHAGSRGGGGRCRCVRLDDAADAVDLALGPAGIVGAHAVDEEHVDRSRARLRDDARDAGKGRAVVHDDGWAVGRGAGSEKAEGRQEGQSA